MMAQYSYHPCKRTASAKMKQQALILAVAKEVTSVGIIEPKLICSFNQKVCSLYSVTDSSYTISTSCFVHCMHALSDAGIRTRHMQ